MKKIRILKAVLIAIALLLPLSALARGIDPIVSTDWLQKNLKKGNLVIVDLRKVEDYQAGHIPGSVNVFYGSWAIKKGDLLNELPLVEDLADVIGGAGIDKNTLVVLVGKTEKIPEQFDMTRVAWTLKYMGVPNVAILSGGITQWVKEGKPVSSEAVRPKAKPFKATVNQNLFIDKAALAGKIGTAIIVDTRAPAFYEGKEKLEFVPKTGRIKGAVNLPVGQLFTPEGLYKSKAELAALAEKAVGKDLAKEIILYCDTGKTCTGWAFIMTDMLGYKDVKVYDGSFMEWAADASAPVE
ncbi:MAG TPA: sulfurtransferase [Smithellaceae bacterium]|nr:sulfurtransferase [Smithellaceae bacterium]HRS88430.1 sulfurtransferase [Smithellaceae bacterium]HRV25486.1 sulfurtransferase [Smithellaceae bacterium]